MFKLTTNLLTRFSSAQPRTKYLFLFGAPGVGKGTFAKKLYKDLDYAHISTGDEFRNIIKGKGETTFSPELVSKIKGIVQSGGLVSDQIVVQVLEEKIKSTRKSGIILDGFPRTEGQLVAYLRSFPVDLVLNLTLSDSVLLEKLMGRRTCSNCGEGYNICNIQRDGYQMDPLLPKKDGICDICGGNLVIRADDTEKVIKERMIEYDAKTRPLLTIFSNIGKLVNFEVKKGVNDYPAVKQLVKAQLGVK